jgi:hypothetical protein
MTGKQQKKKKKQKKTAIQHSSQGLRFNAADDRRLHPEAADALLLDIF